ncbi:MAG: NAD(P)H-dependent oxidoreductase [Prevotellaceae bacterium]|jgi:chromate reductase|nr:NAD(P)H-dependent oxidoreductase [Prevotellaceae bacterium]
MQKEIKIVGICGSLRKDSYNMKILKSVGNLLPDNLEINIAEIAELPMYNEDLDIPDNLPQAVVEFVNILKNADGFVIISPEYNYAVPSVLKNALDWASRSKDLPLSGKPVSIMGATPGMSGTARMQVQLQSLCVMLNMQPIAKPDVLINAVHTKFDANGNFIDEQGKQHIIKNLENLVRLILTNKK